MALTTAQIQQAYVTFFSRPADPVGLRYWQAYTGSIADLYATFAQQTEYSAAFSGLTSAQKVNVVYQNLFGRDAEANGLTYWADKVEAGAITVANLALAVSAGSQGTDLVTVNSRVSAATAFTTALDTTPEILGYTGATANAAAKTWLAGVTTAANLATAVAAIDTATAAVVAVGGAAGSTFTLTSGVDTPTATSGSDTFLASDASGATSFALGGLDVIDGGAGTDTLKVADAATASTGNFSFNGATIKNVENIEVTTSGSFDVTANTGLSLKGYTGLTSATLKAAGTDNSLVLASDTTNVNLTVAGAATAGVTGGKAVSVTADTGLVTVAGDALTSVSIKGGASASTVTNTVSGSGNTGTTLTDVTLEGIATGTAGISGAAVATVTVKNQKVALATTVTNATSTALTVNVDGAGYNSSGTGVAVSVVAGSAAKTITLNATGTKSSVAVSGAAATTLNITGTADLALSSAITTATKIDGSAATGGLTLGVLDLATVNVSTGAGKDSLTLSATDKATVNTGAGNDKVTLASAVAAGSAISLGAGDDSLLVSTGSVAASTSTATTVVDGGDGTDSLAAALINASNAAQFKNFENIDLSALTSSTLDVELMTGSTIKGLTLQGGTGGATVSNVAAGVGLTVTGANSGSSTIGVKGASTGTADSFTTTFADTAASTATAAAPTAISAGTVVTAGVESLNIVSGGTGYVSNSLTVTDSTLQTVTITGDKALSLAFSGTNGTANTGSTDAVNGVKLIDGSAATGALTINLTTNTPTINLAYAGLTVKGGSGKDTITLAQKATVDAGAGDDTIISAAAGGTFTGGAGNDKFDVKLAIATGATEATAIYAKITDLAAGDTIAFASAGAAFSATKTALDNTVTNLDLALAAASNNTTLGQITWFQYGGNTYIVENVDGIAGIAAGDVVVKLTGTVDLSGATYNATTDILTIA